MSDVQHPCRVCPGQAHCSIGRRGHCSRFADYIQSLARMNRQQHIVRELRRLLNPEQGIPCPVRSLFRPL